MTPIIFFYCTRRLEPLDHNKVGEVQLYIVPVCYWNRRSVSMKTFELIDFLTWHVRNLTTTRQLFLSSVTKSKTRSATQYFRFIIRCFVQYRISGLCIAIDRDCLSIRNLKFEAIRKVLLFINRYHPLGVAVSFWLSAEDQQTRHSRTAERTFKIFRKSCITVLFYNKITTKRPCENNAHHWKSSKSHEIEVDFLRTIATIHCWNQRHIHGNASYRVSLENLA